MVSRQDQTFVKLNWFRSGEPLFFIYLFIYFTLSVTTLSLSHIATCKLNKLLSRYAEPVGTKDVERERD
jgi:hypothetical protein